MTAAIGKIGGIVEEAVAPSLLSRAVATVSSTASSVQAIFSRVVGSCVQAVCTATERIIHAISLHPGVTITCAVIILGIVIYKMKQTAPDVPAIAHWRPRITTIAQAERKMEKNAIKAIVEHARHENVYATVGEVRESQKGADRPLSFSVQVAQQAKYRDGHDWGDKYIEDAYFYTKIPEGIILGVLDGHGGDGVSNYVAAEVPKRFSAELRRAKGNVHQAFEALLGAINTEVFKRSEFDYMGTTAVISYIDTAKNVIYTATVADSEANIYRKIGDTHKSIPLSVIRDWSSPKEALRASIGLQTPSIATEWPKSKTPKELRSSGNPEMGGINMSRVIGDAYLSRRCPHIEHKPKITRQKLKAGDILVVASDGLKDYSKAVDSMWRELEHEAAIVAYVNENHSTYTLAHRLVETVAQWNGAPCDDVTALVVTAKGE